jgi:HAD superfamily hydrolase (TIGR01484 family)
VDDSTYDALKRLKETGRQLILVTGRELRNLGDYNLDLFARVVAENGAVVYDPGTKRQHLIGDKAPAVLIRALKEKKVEPLSVGESIIATSYPHETTVLEAIRDLGLEYQIVFNKGAVMALPPGINKATGLKAALAEVELSPHNVIGAGDAENDFAFLETCGCSAAVGNATLALKNTVDVVLEGCWGRGVTDLIEQIIAKDASIIPAERHGIRVGIDRNGNEVQIVPYAGSLLISGSSGIGKSKLATALTERMVEKQFQFCIFDPEGDYDELDHAISLGNVKTPPHEEQALKLLRKSATNAIVNTQALEIGVRPAFFTKLLPGVLSLRARTGRPHWLLIDEAHHLLPASRDELTGILPKHLPGLIMITVHPEAVAIEALRTVDTILALGSKAGDVVATYCKVIDGDALELLAHINGPVDMVFIDADKAANVDLLSDSARARIGDGDSAASRVFLQRDDLTVGRQRLGHAQRGTTEQSTDFDDPANPKAANQELQNSSFGWSKRHVLKTVLHHLFSHRSEFGIFKTENLGYIVQFGADRPHFRARLLILNFTDRVFGIEHGELPHSIADPTL